MASVGADDTKACQAAVACQWVSALIPVRNECATVERWERRSLGQNEILQTLQRLGREIWKMWSGYHRRRLVETKKRCFKLLDERFMARDFDWRFAELQFALRCSIVLPSSERLNKPVWGQRDSDPCLFVQ